MCIYIYSIPLTLYHIYTHMTYTYMLYNIIYTHVTYDTIQYVVYIYIISTCQCTFALCCPSTQTRLIWVASILRTPIPGHSRVPFLDFRSWRCHRWRACKCLRSHTEAKLQESGSKCLRRHGACAGESPYAVHRIGWGLGEKSGTLQHWSWSKSRCCQ